MKEIIKKHKLIIKLAKHVLLMTILLSPVYSQQAPAAVPAHNLPVVSMGAQNAPIKVIMYHSLNCPHCKEFKLHQLPIFKKKYIDKGLVYFEMRDFPIDAVSMAASKLAWCKELSAGSYVKHSNIISDNFKIEEKEKVEVDWANVESPNKAIDRLVELLGHHGVPPKECYACLAPETGIENDILQSCMDVISNYKLDYAPGFLVNGVLVELPNLEKEIEKNLPRP